MTGAVEPPADDLPGDLASAHAMILAQRELLAAARSEAKARVLEIERLKLELARARRERFGQSSERGKLIAEQLELAIEDLEETQAEEEARAEMASPARAEKQRRPRGPRKLPDNLPVERVVETAPCVCGRCGGARLRKLGEVMSKTLECEPRRWKIVERVREKFACRDCQAVTEPPAPSHAIPRGLCRPEPARHDPGRQIWRPLAAQPPARRLCSRGDRTRRLDACRLGRRLRRGA